MYSYICYCSNNKLEKKNWPLEKYKKLIQKLLEKEKNYFSSVILLGSEDEKIYCENLKKSVSSRNIFNLAGMLKILEIYELFKSLLQTFLLAMTQD